MAYGGKSGGNKGGGGGGADMIMAGKELLMVIIHMTEVMAVSELVVAAVVMVYTREIW